MIQIGIMGALVSNENMGCVALTYSLLSMLERIARRSGQTFRYVVFEYHNDPEKYRLLREQLSIDPQRIRFAPVGYWDPYDWPNLKRSIKSTPQSLDMLRLIAGCRLVIDLTQGDSFTDLYGRERFVQLTMAKEWVLRLGVALVLGPQTYGPFASEAYRARVRRIAQRAALVMARDVASADYLASFCPTAVHKGTDLAFRLPFDAPAPRRPGPVRVGVNPSGLLVRQKNEGTPFSTPLATDYDRFIAGLLRQLTGDPGYEVHLIPHVGADGTASFRDVPGVIVHDAFDTPIQAKNCIAGMDVFIGARMHATIAAFSAGVATIPTAYSQKFAGVFSAVGYDHVIDLRTLPTDRALAQTLALIRDRRQLQEEGARAMDLVRQRCDDMEQTLAQTISSILQGGK